MQAFCLSHDQLALCAIEQAILEGQHQPLFESVAVDSQLVRESRCQQARRNCKNADAHQSQDDGERSSHRGDGRYVAIANGSQGDHRPVDGLRDVLELIGLCRVLKQITQAGREHHQQHHHKHGRKNHLPFTQHHFVECFHGGGVACELEHAHQAEDAQEAQVEMLA